MGLENTQWQQNFYNGLMENGLVDAGQNASKLPKLENDGKAA